MEGVFYSGKYSLGSGGPYTGVGGDRVTGGIWRRGGLSKLHIMHRWEVLHY